MAYWLMKSERETWSWDEQVEKGERGEPWTGVRNHQAKLHLKAMKRGDRAFFYHSGDERSVVGIVEVAREAYPDPTIEPDSKSKDWVVVDVVARDAFVSPVTLAAIREEPTLSGMVLVKNSRLSVQPVTAAEWKRVCKMGGVKA